ncbi:hypothetical protein HHL22_18400 [Hymenobacter sp. RP-2-7]|uniref:Right-handed parallel beta-helix repeat-containing protein n=1 Tax=Hymenobacter polaris TaxID=2682546 RepID=A0A7Y0AH36_9BACT|nr:hypothetical protein [Hymenobacter polaris]NML67180.1 hypothetical protein [Hymenobacter polaris]
MRYRYVLIFLMLSTALGGLWLPGCKPREEQLQTSGGLEFSADTVKFDTVFTTLRTVTKRLWVYNRNPKAVSIDLISLDNPSTSPYTLLINGDLKQTATSVQVRGQDSLLILVRAQLKDNGQNGLAKAYVQQDYLNFSTNGQQQRVLLRSFGQNIYLHQHTRLPCNAVWTNDRPHVLYDTVVVPAGCTLRLKPGTRVYAHAGAVLIVQGTLLVNSPADFTPGSGATDTISAKNASVVRFAGDRSNEAQYATAPGQWTGIQFYPGSRGNLVRYATVQNAAQGLLVLSVSGPAIDLAVQNSVVRYISGGSVSFAGLKSNGLGLQGAGILNVFGKVTVENTLFSDCYEFAMYGLGGSNSLNFCTVANYPATNGVRQTASLTFSNDTTKNYPTAVSVRNSVVWGSIDDELYLEGYKDYKATASVQNTLLKTKLYAGTTDALRRPGLAATALNNIVNQDPKFLKLYAGSLSDYRLSSTSPAYQCPSPAGGLLSPNRDLLNLPRSATPTLGAYESTKK